MENRISSTYEPDKKCVEASGTARMDVCWKKIPIMTVHDSVRRTYCKTSIVRFLTAVMHVIFDMCSATTTAQTIEEPASKLLRMAPNHIHYTSLERVLTHDTATYNQLKNNQQPYLTIQPLVTLPP